jgi:hypothetical protein
MHCTDDLTLLSSYERLCEIILAKAAILRKQTASSALVEHTIENLFVDEPKIHVQMQTRPDTDTLPTNTTHRKLKRRFDCTVKETSADSTTSQVHVSSSSPGGQRQSANSVADVKSDSSMQSSPTCTICLRRFTSRYGRQNLVYHMKTVHNGVRAHTCEYCDKAMCSPNALERHRRTHTDERPFVCAVCARAFHEKGTLQRHARTHTNVKLAKCEHN